MCSKKYKFSRRREAINNKETVNIGYIVLLLAIGLIINGANIFVKKGIDTDSVTSLLCSGGHWSEYYDLIDKNQPPALKTGRVSDIKKLMNLDKQSNVFKIWNDADFDVHPPFYFVFLYVWRSVFGEALFTAKLCNVFTYLFSAIIFFFLSKEVFDRKYALCALLFYVFTPASFTVTEQIRPYALLGLFNIVALYSVIKIVHENIKWKWWIIWGISSLAAMYTHYIYATVFIPIAAYLLFFSCNNVDRKYLKRYIKTAISFSVLLIPLIWLFWRQKSLAYDMGWSGGWLVDKNFSSTMIWVFIGTIIGAMKGIIFSAPVWLNIGIGIVIYSAFFYFLTKIQNKKDFWLFASILVSTTIFYTILYQTGAIPSHAVGTKYQVCAVPIILIAITAIVTVIEKRNIRIIFIVFLAAILLLGSIYYIWKNCRNTINRISTYSVNKLVPKTDLVILDSTFSGLVGPVIYSFPVDQKIIIGSQKDLLLKTDWEKETKQMESIVYINAVKYNELALQDKILDRFLETFGVLTNHSLEPVAKLGCEGAGKGYNIFFMEKRNDTTFYRKTY